MPRRSPVWAKFYDHPKFTGVSVCKICKANVQRGGRVGTNTNTTNLFSHLAAKHRAEYDQLKLNSNKRVSAQTSEASCSSSSCARTEDPAFSEDDDLIQTSPLPVIKRQTTLDSIKAFSTILHSESSTAPTSSTPLVFGKTTSQNGESAASTCSNQTSKTYSNIRSLKIYDYLRPKSLRSTSATATRINVDISRLIVEQMLPFSIVDSAAFRSLITNLEPGYHVPSRMYFCRIMLPFIQKELIDDLRLELQSVKSCSITTDCWTAKPSPDVALMSVTCHWVNEKDMSLQHAVLAAKPLQSRHYALNLRAELLAIFNNWGLDGKVKAIISDNAANIVAALENIPGVTHIPCASHSLQLIVTSQVLQQASVKQIITQAKKIVCHYKHSTQATIGLQKSQAAINVPIHRLIQDVPTRWNSTFLMLNRLYEQREAILDHLSKEMSGAKGDAAKQLQNIMTVYLSLDLDEVDYLIELLKPFYEFTAKLSKDCSIASEIIPLARGTKSQIADQKLTEMESTQEAYLENFSSRFDPYEEIDFCTFATALDPRYKLHIFSEAKRIAIRESILLKISEQSGCVSRVNEMASSNTSENEKSKRARTNLDFALRRVLGRTEEKRGGDPESTELDDYLRIDPIDLDADPFEWWRINAISFPRVAKLAALYLHAPSTSVASERLFSIAGRAYTPLRNRLKGNRAEMLLLLNANRERGT